MKFLHLFSLPVLELLRENGSWNRLLPIELSPGSGKSTLLRLFTPTVLTSIANRRHQTELAAFVEKLTTLDAIDANGVQLLGVLVNCKDDFNRLADLPLDEPSQEGLFWALLHSRLALLTIRAALQLKGYAYPGDVDRVGFEPKSDGVLRRPDPRFISGNELFERSRVAEQLLVDCLNSFVPRRPSFEGAPSYDDFFQILNTHRIILDGRPVAKHILIMFDDAHMLEESQRNALRRELERHDQSAFASWLAMRLRGLQPPEIISEQVRRDREGYETFTFDTWPPARIQSWFMDVGNRRATRARQDVSSFEACLSNSLTTEFSNSTFEKAADKERERTYSMAELYGQLYSSWLEHWETIVADSQPLDQALLWAQLQISMQRRIQNLQGEFVLEPLPIAYVERPRSDTRDMATIFMSYRNGLPYLFGAKRVA